MPYSQTKSDRGTTGRAKGAARNTNPRPPLSTAHTFGDVQIKLLDTTPKTAMLSVTVVMPDGKEISRVITEISSSDGLVLRGTMPLRCVLDPLSNSENSK